MLSLFKACDFFYKKAVFVHNFAKSGNKVVIAFRQNIWILDIKTAYDPDHIRKYGKRKRQMFFDIIKGIGAEHIHDDIEYSFNSLINNIYESRPDVLFAHFSTKGKDRSLYIISGAGFSQSPKSSPLVQKVSKKLGITEVHLEEMVGEEEMSERFGPQDIQGKLPDVLYHGTSAKYAGNILRMGLTAAVSKSNYPQVIHHEDEVFLAVKFVDAAAHAEHTNSRISGSFPIVFGFKIPDSSRLIPDYDVDIGSSQTMWAGRKSNIDIPQSGDPEQSMKLSRDVGIVGYTGRIPANFIASMYVRHPFFGNEYKEVSVNDLYALEEHGVSAEILAEMEQEMDQEEDDNYLVSSSSMMRKAMLMQNL